jgi:hypothetical protein
MALNFDFVGESKAEGKVVEVFSGMTSKEDVAELILQFQSEIDNQYSIFAGIEVSDDENLRKIQDGIGVLSALESKIEKKRVEIKAPYLDFTTFLDQNTASIKVKIRGYKNEMKNKMIPYVRKKEEERRQAEREKRKAFEAENRRIQEEAARKAAKIAAENKLNEKEKKQVEQSIAESTIPVVPDVKENVSFTTQNTESKHFRKLKFDVVSFKDIPDDIINERLTQLVKAITPAINNMIKVGIRNISGIRIYEVDDVKVTNKK